jgi:hypothetical protein
MPFAMEFGRAGVLFINPASIPRVDHDLMSLEQLGSMLKGACVRLLNFKIHSRIILRAPYRANYHFVKQE